MRGTRHDVREDPYVVLGVSPSASSAQIRAAHRRLVMQVHPDCNPHPAAAERFERVQQAYELLIDPVRRAALDAQRQRIADAERQRAGEAAAVAGAATANTRARAAASATPGDAQRA